jgi:hypothetical protein
MALIYADKRKPLKHVLRSHNQKALTAKDAKKTNTFLKHGGNRGSRGSRESGDPMIG